MKKIATALSYPEGSKAPLITAQGKGELAERMLEIAKQHNIPIFSEPDNPGYYRFTTRGFIRKKLMK